MSDRSSPADPALPNASMGYVVTRLYRAIDNAQRHPDADVRERTQRKVERWHTTLANMLTGRLHVGSRTPVSDTPPWVTLDVAHGGFATGAYLAELPLDNAERELLVRVPAATSEDTERARVNAWYQSDVGLSTLARAVEEGRYRIDVPEEGALCVVAWLVAHDHDASALELLDQLRPWMHRLRMAPTLEALSKPSGACVRRMSVAEVSRSLAQTAVPPQLAVMREVLGVWNVLYDNLVALWLDTVEGPPPTLADQSTQVCGGWPCKRWPDDWETRRQQWLNDHARAKKQARGSNRHQHPRSNFFRLRKALELCRANSDALSAHQTNWIRRALANTITRHGLPDSTQRIALRNEQNNTANAVTFENIAALLISRLQRFPADGGLPSLQPIDENAKAGEHARVPAGTAPPAHLVRKVERALEAPISELVERGVIASNEVLASVVPQVTAQVDAAGIESASLRELYARIYASFRRRRSLLLMDLKHQVQLAELPWVAALAPFRSDGLRGQTLARQTLEQLALLAVVSFPHAVLPNPLLREFATLAERAQLPLPLVETLAADIFTGQFTNKWATAADHCYRATVGKLYARYYSLPDNAQVASASKTRSAAAFSGYTPEAFATQCEARAAEAYTPGHDISRVAQNGAIIEQSQILTSHNLAPLVDTLGLAETLAGFAPQLVQRTFDWILRRQTQPLSHAHAQLTMLKNTAYAWRQAIYLLSLCDEHKQRQAVLDLRQALSRKDSIFVQRFMPVVAGLDLTVAGGSFDKGGRGVGMATARRFLGWSLGRHWLWR